MDNSNDSLITEFEDCIQCGRPAVKEISPYTNEYTKTCSTCGRVEISTLEEGLSITVGCGSLSIGGVCKALFHQPITFVQEHDILKTIENEDTAVFLKWSEEEQCLIPIKGEVPKTFEDLYQEQCEAHQQEKEYYSSFDSYTNPSDIVDINNRMKDIRPIGRIM